MKIVAASCCKLQSIDPQPVWREIRDEKPDALLLIGDNVYLDHDHHADAATLQAELSEKYRAQLAEPHFADLLQDMRSRHALVAAIYDDHDFLGNNRYGGEHPTELRDAARAAFVEAFRPATTGDDVYRLHKLGLVDLFVLDARYYRKSPSSPDSSRDAVLGVRQWNWLEDAIDKSSAPYKAIVSSTTLHTFADESWEQYPAAFNRMVKLLTREPGRFVLSGDVHRNAAYDDSGALEIVTSAVARKGIVFGSPRQNYAVLSFDAQKLHVELRSLKVQWRMKFDVALEHWSLG